MNQNSVGTSFRIKFQDTVNRVLQSNRKNTILSSLTGSARAFFISMLSKQVDVPLLVVAESYEAAELIKQDLEFFSDASSVNFFPHWDTIPYDNQSPSKDVLAIRFQSLQRILEQKACITVTTPNAIMQQILPPSVFLNHCFNLKKSETYERDNLLKNLVRNGFTRVEMVEEKGEFSVRGEIIDIFPITEPEPVRLDFFDNELESIKSFDVETQRSTEQLSSVAIFPAQEVLFSKTTTQNALDGLQSIKTNTVPQLYHSVVEQIESNVGFPGMENLLPLFYSSTATVLDYFSQSPWVLFLEKSAVKNRSEDFFDEILSEYEYSRREGHPTMDPDKLYLTSNGFFSSIEQYKAIDIQALNLENNQEIFDLSTVDNAAIRSLALSDEAIDQSSVYNVLKQLKTWNQNKAKIAIAVDSHSKGDRIRQMLEEIDLTVPILKTSSDQECSAFFNSDFSPLETSFCIIPSPISKGFRWIDQVGNTKIALISDEEIFGTRRKQSRVRKNSLKHFFSSLGDLKVGDYVVHVEYGIGKYEGLKKITAGTNESDYLVIVYQGGDKVYVPVDKFHLVQKYKGGDDGRPKVNKLGSKAWTRTKSKIRSEVDDMAEELVRINAIRKAKKGVAFSPDSSLMNEFTLSFPYQETDDQEKAIQDVIQDMELEQPMDRLVCGDVGFGKTEVAMRASYKAAIDGFQIGILVPTTILAKQHFDSFSKRFENTSVSIGMLSRFQTPARIRETLKDLKEGSIDIAIGTHRLLSNDVVFKKLGLLVIDEEQRFGVKHKEKIRKYRTTVDTLTLSATPIPRTLHMSLVGIRDISVINTPPMDRRSIRTRLMKFNDYVIQEAVNREIRRNGQIFFIHNRVESIYQVGQYLSSILPNVKLAVAHGQMSERDLEKVMFDFIDKQYDVLLSTTIVESGLDIPNVNTIIINNADQFGLSQLYQLRGRVGRSNLQAYSYLMTPREKVLTETARKRLAILQELNHLGAGFKIANYDLELRGAGNVLGSQQSGHIAAVGFELYTSMIEDAVSKIQMGETVEVRDSEEVKLNLNIDANLPDSYISSMNQRLDAYKTISSCKTEDELWEVRSSLEDRYGKMPEETVCLFYSMQIKFLLAQLHISQLNHAYDSLDMVFNEKFKPDPEVLLNYLGDPKNKAKLLPDNRLIVGISASEPQEILQFLHGFKKEIFYKK